MSDFVCPGGCGGSYRVQPGEAGQMERACLSCGRRMESDLRAEVRELRAQVAALRTHAPLTGARPYAVYCLARAHVLYGEKFELERCGGDVELCFAALLGMEDGIRFQHNLDHRVYTEGVFLTLLTRVIKARQRPEPSGNLLDDIADATSARIQGEG